MSGFSVGAGYGGQSVAFFNRLATDPGITRAQQYDILIRSLVNAGVWSLLDALWILAAADSATALTNLVSVSNGLTATNAPAFVADRGYTGDGATSLLTGPNLSTAGGLFTLNDCHMGVWVGTDVGVNTSADIGLASSNCTSKSTSSLSKFRANDGTTSSGPSAASSIGHFMFSRAVSTTYTAYRNGTNATVINVTTTSITNAAMRVCGSSNTFGIRQCSAGHVGGSMTAAQVAAMYQAVGTYLQSVGAPTP